MDKNHWLLPEGIDEIVPPQAAVLEQTRRQLLDMYDSWGYDLVMPPFIEFLDSLMMGAGKDIDLKTFKITDQVSGRMMGFRADMTTQVARIDAHHLENDAPARLCYQGTVLHARPDGFGGTRAPFQIGAELYGHPGYQSDVEVISLMLETFALAQVENVSVDLGHVGIFRGLAEEAGLNDRQEAILFEALQRKAVPELRSRLKQFETNQAVADKILALSDLNGSDVIEQARSVLSGSSACVIHALDYIENVANAIHTSYPNLPLHFDLAELRGYNFHTGIVFSAFVPESGVEVARGGRYDNIGGDFGRARPATGFSTDLKSLLNYSTASLQIKTGGIIAPCFDDVDEGQDGLKQMVSDLRSQGKRVVCLLPGQSGTATDLCCNEQLIFQHGIWQVQPL
ncbi:MAG: ATP phosphoribosyltransferase regulatory subunit [Gammaproteobacteria bacterium]|nr:ATP phosphoribosyltransferase regulatory subunit [Gammaproteobacteria bacterium]